MNCPRCSSEMLKGTPRTINNAKYMLWECEVCNHEEMKCTGVLTFK